MNAPTEPRLGIYREGDNITLRNAAPLKATAKREGWRLKGLWSGEGDGIWGYRLERVKS